ncbi:hypothetical protein [Chryseobacterium sp. MP_3.2]|uniref:hypothetical protein n=1 Tax=Chryseobacterium sp. MP_3.2 TaxID=3071712 RepID=UPI002E04BC01|nr:hypothetical protein [Chryseobacterium sp. MP_3.2]
MQWNREIAGLIIIISMIFSAVLLVLRRRNLEGHIFYFIGAIVMLSLIEITGFVTKLFDHEYNTSKLYAIGTNFFVFLLYLLYFQKILQIERLRKINALIIALFVANYLGSALLIEEFFTRFSFVSYFVQVILLTGSINLVMSQTFNSDKILSLSTYFPFWVCISLLIIYLGVLPLLMISNAAQLMNLNLFFAILFLVNFLGYIILLVGIMKAKTKLETI